MTLAPLKRALEAPRPLAGQVIWWSLSILSILVLAVVLILVTARGAWNQPSAQYLLAVGGAMAGGAILYSAIKVGVWVPLRTVERRVASGSPTSVIVACWRPAIYLRSSALPLHKGGRVLAIEESGISLWGSDSNSEPLISVVWTSIASAEGAGGSLMLRLKGDDSARALWPREYVLGEYRPMSAGRVASIAEFLTLRRDSQA